VSHVRCSEVADIPSQSSYYERDRLAVSCGHTGTCDHLAADLARWEDEFGELAELANITVVKPTLLSNCSIPAGRVLNRITVAPGGHLVFNHQDFLLRVREILVLDGGALTAGSVDCPFGANLTIEFVGSAADSISPTFPDESGRTSKGLLATGNVTFFGQQYFPTWTRLAATVTAGSDLLYLQDFVNWEVGQQLLVTTSVLFDCPDEYKDEYCRGDEHENEVRTIVAVSQDPDSRLYVVQVDEPMSFEHYGGPEYQSEVALLSRKITLRGSDSGDSFGGHTLYTRSAIAHIDGVAAINMGKRNVLAQYPFHLHLLDDGSLSHLRSNVVLDSFFRAYVVHGTNGTFVERNIAYNVAGMAYYLEDGVEERNSLLFNLAAHVHPIYKPADGGYGQGGEQFNESQALVVPADTSASGFYILNAFNTIVGNAASGGWSGFAFPNAPEPIGLHRGSLGRNNPLNRPTLRFSGNTAHSSGFYWKGHGSCFYTGAWLSYEYGNRLHYDSGRHERSTQWPNGTQAWMELENVAAWLCGGKGIAHWGDRARISNYEVYDSWNSAMTFGESTIRNALIVGRSGNEYGWSTMKWGNKMAFQAYDTWVKTVLVGVTVRNFTGSDDRVFTGMYHSDQFIPQNINGVGGIRYEQVPSDRILSLYSCGADCEASRQTMSSRIYNFLDYDGTFSTRGNPAIVGTNIPWWDRGPDECVFHDDWKMHVCDWRERMNVGFFMLKVDGLTDGCDTAVITCQNQYAGYSVGRVNMWGNTTRAVDLGPWPGVSGYVNTGWLWRAVSPLHGVDGAPSKFRVGPNFNLEPGSFVVLAVRYPASTTFEVTMHATHWSAASFDPMPMSSKADVLANREDVSGAFDCTGGQWWSMCTDYGSAVGPAWHFDGTYLYIRVVYPGYYNRNEHKRMSGSEYGERGVFVHDIMQSFSYMVSAQCSGCAVQSTHAGVTYYQVADTTPSAFPEDFGAVRTALDLPAGATTRTCEQDTLANDYCDAYQPAGTDAPATGGGGGGKGDDGGSGEQGGDNSTAGSPGGALSDGDAATSDSEGSSSNVGLIVGAVVAGVLLLLLVAFFVVRSRHDRRVGAMAPAREYQMDRSSRRQSGGFSSSPRGSRISRGQVPTSSAPWAPVAAKPMPPVPPARPSHPAPPARPPRAAPPPPGAAPRAPPRALPPRPPPPGGRAQY